MADLIQIGVDVNTNIKQATSDLDKMGGSVLNNIRTIDRLESEIKQLNRALDKGRVTENAYRKGMQQINGELLLFQQRAAKAAQVEQRFGAAAAGGGKSLNRFNMTLQQGGYQLQDFIVQLQGGTSFFTAFSQQGSQFASIFGPKGAVIGAVIALGSAIGGSLVAGLFKARGEIKEFSDQLKETTSDLDEYFSLLKQNDSALFDAFEGNADAIRSTSQAAKDLLAIAKIKAFDSVKSLAESLSDANTEAGLLDKALLRTDIGVTGDLLNLETVLAGNITTWKDVREQVNGFISDVRGISQGSNIDEMYESAIRARDAFKGYVDVSGEMTDQQKSFWEQISQTILQLELLGAATKAQAGATRDLAKEQKNIDSMGVVFLKAQQRIRAENGARMEENLRLEREGYAAAAMGAQTLRNEIAANQEEMVAVFQEAQKLKEQLGEGAYEALRLAGVDMKSGIDAAALSAAKLAADLNISLAAALTMQKMASDEDAVMSQSVVKGKATDRYDVDTLLGMGYTEEYLKLIGKIKDETKKLGKTTKKTLTDAEKAAKAYADALDNTVVSAVGSVSDAWADFVMRGFKDFKGFVGAVLDSFKNMIAQMIAMAAKNRIMLSLGIGGVAPTGAMAGSGLLQGAGILGGGGAGFGAAMSGVGSGLSGVLSGGGMASSFANLGGLASGAVGGFGAIGAAIPAVGALIAGAAVLKKIFGGKKPLFSEEQFEGMADAALLTGQSFRELAADLEGVESGAVSMSRATQAVIKSIADATGGMEEFAKKSAFFFENFYTESEQQQYLTAKATEELNKQFAELNVAVPQTHEEYRRLVQAQDLTTESGREMYAALLNVSDAFVAVKGSAEASAAQTASFMERRNAEVSASMLQTRATRFLEQNDAINRIDEVGTTLAQNEYLLNQFVEDYNIFVDEFNAKKESSYDPNLSKINRETLEQMTDIDEVLAEGLEATSSIQAATFEWYQGTRKTRQNIINEIKQLINDDKATERELTLFKTQGEIPASYQQEFGKYGMFEQMPYFLELTMFIKERIQEIGSFTRAAVDVMSAFGDYNKAFSVVPDAIMDLNKSLTGIGPEIDNAASFMGQLADNVVGAFGALQRGFEKISEAIGKVNTFYKDQFSALAAEYNVQDVATQSIDISGRMTSIIDAPARLITIIEDNMRVLGEKQKKLDAFSRRLESEMNHLTQNGIEVSEELATAYDRISYAAAGASRAAQKASEELQALKLYVSTMTQAVQDFEASVEKMLVQDIAEGVKFYEPSLLAELTGNTRVLVANILKSITEGGYEAFEEGFVRLTDMFTQNSLTVDQFNQSFGLLRDVFEGNISLTDEYTQKQASVIEKLSNAYDNLTSSLEGMLSVVSRGIGSLVGQTASANVVATRLGSLSYLSSVASGGQAEAGSLERAVSSVTSIGATDFSTRQDFMRYVADTTQLLRSVEGTLEGQLETLEMQQVQAILGIQETNESAATSLQSIQSLLAEFLGVGGRIPQFASGGYHSGGLRIVGENGPELEATGPSRIIPNNKISVGGDSELRREVAEMRTDLKTALVQIAKNTRKSSDTLNKFDYQGLPDSRGY